MASTSTQLPPYRRVEVGHGGIAMIFQEPMSSLNPVLKIGEQIEEAVAVHEKLAGAARTRRARELLEMVRIPDAALQLSAYPHQLSGGMRQRVMIAIALACQPQVLIADEPTTALDVTVQAQILSLLRELCDTLGLSILFITHDLGVVAQLVDRVAVMYAGRDCRDGDGDAAVRASGPSLHAGPDGMPARSGASGAPADDHSGAGAAAGRDSCKGVLSRRAAATRRRVCRAGPVPYAALADDHSRSAVFRSRVPRMSERPILEVRGLSTDYTVKRGGRHDSNSRRRRTSPSPWRAARCSASSANPDAARPRSAARSCGWPSRIAVRCCSTAMDIFAAKAGALRSLRLKIRMVFQDPFASLNPRRSIGDSVAEAGDIHGLFANAVDRARQVEKALDRGRARRLVRDALSARAKWWSAPAGRHRARDPADA